MPFDVRGVPVSTSSRASLDAYERAVELMHEYAGNPLGVIEEALARDPGFVLGHCFKAALIAGATDKSLEPELRKTVEAGEALARGGNDRERAHLAAARAWLDGHFDRAVDLWGRIAVAYPRDTLAIQSAHVGDFYLGQQTLLRDRIAQTLHAWDETVPGYGWVLGMYAFGLEETGDYARAEEVGRLAVQIQPRDAWASHAVAHVMEMQARIEEGIAWLSETSRRWAPDNGFAYHNHWHRALYHLDLGDAPAALAVYDHSIRPGHSQVVLEMIDASALLWRMHLLDVDVGGRWDELADAWRERAREGYYVFNDVHALMAFLGARREADAQAVLETVASHAGDSGTNGEMIRKAGLPVCRALDAFARGAYDECVEHLLPARHVAIRFGGSNAQRDVLSQTLLEAALRAGRASLARALTSERIRLRPSNPACWVAAARALEVAGDAAGAVHARRQALRLRGRRREDGAREGSAEAERLCHPS